MFYYKLTLFNVTLCLYEFSFTNEIYPVFTVSTLNMKGKFTKG